MLHFETINVDGHRKVWDFDTVEELKELYLTEGDYILPSNDDEVTYAVLDGERLSSETFLDLMLELDLPI